MHGSVESWNRKAWLRGFGAGCGTSESGAGTPSLGLRRASSPVCHMAGEASTTYGIRPKAPTAREEGPRRLRRARRVAPAAATRMHERAVAPDDDIWAVLAPLGRPIPPTAPPGR